MIWFISVLIGFALWGRWLALRGKCIIFPFGRINLPIWANGVAQSIPAGPIIAIIAEIALDDQLCADQLFERRSDLLLAQIGEQLTKGRDRIVGPIPPVAKVPAIGLVLLDPEGDVLENHRRVQSHTSGDFGIKAMPAHDWSPKCAQTCEFCTGFVREIGRFSRFRRESARDFLRASAQRPVNKPYFSGVFGDPDRIRTCNLPLRRGLLYPVEPRGRPLSYEVFCDPASRPKQSETGREMNTEAPDRKDSGSKVVQARSGIALNSMRISWSLHAAPLAHLDGRNSSHDLAAMCGTVTNAHHALAVNLDLG